MAPGKDWKIFSGSRAVPFTAEVGRHNHLILVDPDGNIRASLDGYAIDDKFFGGGRMAIKEFTADSNGRLIWHDKVNDRDVELTMGPVDRSTWVEVPLTEGRTALETWDAFNATAAKHDGVHDYQYNAAINHRGKFNSNSAWRALLEENGYGYRKLRPRGGGFAPGVRKRLPEERTPEPDPTDPGLTIQGMRRSRRVSDPSPQQRDDRSRVAAAAPTDTAEDRSPEDLSQNLPQDLPEDLPLALSERFDDSGSRFEATLRLDADGNPEAPVEGDAYVDLIAKHAVPLTKPDMSGIFFALPRFAAGGVFLGFETIRNAKGDRMEVDFWDAMNRRPEGRFSAAARAVAEGASSRQPAGETQLAEPTQPVDRTEAAGPAEPDGRAQSDRPAQSVKPTQPSRQTRPAGQRLAGHGQAEQRQPGR